MDLKPMIRQLACGHNWTAQTPARCGLCDCCIRCCKCDKNGKRKMAAYAIKALVREIGESR